MKWRREALGYREPHIGEFELLPTLDAALHEAFVEGIRHARHNTAEQATSKVIKRLLRDTGYNAADSKLEFSLPYNYKVVILWRTLSNWQGLYSFGRLHLQLHGSIRLTVPSMT